MYSPVWSNDLLYLKECIIITILTIIITAVCFYISKRDDRKRSLRIANALAHQANDESTESLLPSATVTTDSESLLQR